MKCNEAEQMGNVNEPMTLNNVTKKLNYTNTKFKNNNTKFITNLTNPLGLPSEELYPCKFCQIYEIGVPVINSVAILLMILMIVLYWNDMKKLCQKSSKLRVESQSTPISISDKTVEIPAILPQKTIIQESLQPPPVPSSPSPFQLVLPSPAQQQQQQQLPPLLKNYKTAIVDVHKTKTANSHTKRSKLVTPTILTNPLNAPFVDPFKLPTKTHLTHTLDHYESTGSNYFQQLNKGKKPVTSVSQYLLNQKKEKEQKGKKKGKNKAHNDHGKKKDTVNKKDKRKHTTATTNTVNKTNDDIKKKDHKAKERKDDNFSAFL